MEGAMNLELSGNGKHTGQRLRHDLQQADTSYLRRRGVIGWRNNESEERPRRQTLAGTRRRGNHRPEEIGAVHKLRSYSPKMKIQIL